MLRTQGYTVAVYIDDIIAIDQSFEEWHLTVVETINLFQKLGFVIYPDKIKFIPAKIVEYFSCILGSRNIKIRKKKVYEKCSII